MNVIISNKNQNLLENLGIDIIKEMNGEFDVDEIIATFQNFFYQRMIIDITAIKDYKNIENLQKLSISLSMDKVILLLDGSEETSSPIFLSKLVSMGIYNFTKNVEGIQYLYNTPNTYRDVAQFQDLAIQVGQPAVSQDIPQAPVSIVPIVESAPPSMESYGTRIIGLKNVTKQSGASSLVYMMKKELSKNYKVLAMEVDKSDFGYFRDPELMSVITNDVGTIIKKNEDKDIIIIDINNSIVAEGFCEEIVYLIEPSIIKLQKLMKLNATAIQGLKGKKVILNQSLLSDGEVAEFEYESKLKIFYNLPPLNERDKSLPELNKLLVKLGFDRQESAT